MGIWVLMTLCKCLLQTTPNADLLFFLNQFGFFPFTFIPTHTVTAKFYNKKRKSTSQHLSIIMHYGVIWLYQ